MSVLIVDSEPCVREVASNVLRYAGFQAVAVAAPHEALLFAASQPAIELLLAELNLPEMPGIELARQFVSLSPSTGLMFMSGYVQQRLISGMLPLLVKPFTAGLLIRRVEDALRPQTNTHRRFLPELQISAVAAPEEFERPFLRQSRNN